GPVIQVDDYYPYGMAFNHELLANEVLNRYLYQGKEKLSNDTDWYDFHARMYSPALGRFLGVDTQGQFDNPYNGMGNNPVVMVDPNGEFVSRL
nr:RHS repeat-associated core domain-containing protein [Bacteroidota bacterium]